MKKQKEKNKLIYLTKGRARTSLPASSGGNGAVNLSEDGCVGVHVPRDLGAPGGVLLAQFFPPLRAVASIALHLLVAWSATDSVDGEGERYMSQNNENQCALLIFCACLP